MLMIRKKSGVEKEKDLGKDHGVFFLGALCDELLFKLRLAPANDVLIGPQ